MDMSRMLLFLSFLFSFAVSKAQVHFNKTGNFTEAMNIYVLEAKVNGINLGEGDEIGIYCRNLCVGYAVLSESLEEVFDDISKSVVTGSDDTETSENDGFIAGDPVIFKFWDLSEKQEIEVGNVKFYNPDNGSEITPKTFKVGATAYVSLNATCNYTPVSDAGTDRIISEGQQIVLDGSDSYDLNIDSTTLKYHWNSLNGGVIDVSDERTVIFTAPFLFSDSTFYFSLVVFDGEKYSSPDTIAITVVHTNLPPIADAGEDIIINEREDVILNGTASFDPERKTLLYEWNSDYLIFDDIYSSKPVFIAPELNNDTTVFITLRVSDKELWSETDTVSVTILNKNTAPEWILLPTYSAYIGKSYSGFIQVYDSDPFDRLQISIYNLPAWLTYEDHGDGTAEIYSDSVPETDSILGEWNFMISATDGSLQIDTTIVLGIRAITGIINMETAKFKVFPNPSNGWITVQLNNWNDSKKTLRIFNTSGVLIHEEPVSQLKTRIDTRYFGKGIYLLEFTEGDNQTEGVKLLLSR